MKYEWWVVSDSFLKRSFAIWWHMMFAYLVTVLSVWIVVVAITSIAWI